MKDKAYISILENIGGKENVLSQNVDKKKIIVFLKDNSQVDINALQSMSQVDKASIKDKEQLVIQMKNEQSSLKTYEMINAASGDKDSEKGSEKGSEKEISRSRNGKIDRVFEFMAKVFSPVIPALAGSGILKGILLLLNQLGILGETDGIFIILSISSNAIFYFLPIILAFSTSQVLKVNPYIGVLISFTLLHPEFIQLFEDSVRLDVLNIPVVLISYGSTVLPIILSIILYSYVYNFSIKKLPDSMEIILIPLITLVVVVPITILIIGPFGFYSGELLAQFVSFLIGKNGTLAGVIIGGLWMVIIMAGLNWAINPIILNNISVYGFDYIRPFTFAANFSALGVVLGVFLATKQKEVKNLSGTNVLTIGISGIVEPTLYGVLIKDKRYFIIQIISGAIGGAYIGYNEVVTNAFVFGSLLTLPALASERSSNLIHGLIGIFLSVGISTFVSFVLTKNSEKRSLIL